MKPILYHYLQGRDMRRRRYGLAATNVCQLFRYSLMHIMLKFVPTFSTLSSIHLTIVFPAPTATHTPNSPQLRPLRCLTAPNTHTTAHANRYHLTHSAFLAGPRLGSCGVHTWPDHWPRKLSEKSTTAGPVAPENNPPRFSLAPKLQLISKKLPYPPFSPKTNPLRIAAPASPIAIVHNHNAGHPQINSARLGRAPGCQPRLQLRLVPLLADH